MEKAENLLLSTLQRRQKAGKESTERFEERFGITSRERPEGTLIWLHAASVGEAQSALILLKTICERDPHVNILVTTGTLTSAALMEKSLPQQAFHQFYPVDHPGWTQRFLDHWAPDLVLWMESELWPNMLLEIRKREIPALLINARMSPKSFRRWKLLRKSAAHVLASFSHILCQTEKDAEFFRKLGAQTVSVTDNIKYNAPPLPASEQDLQLLNAAIAQRPCWVYASTHDGEEMMAARIHAMVKNALPDLLTIIVPRHPERRKAIVKDIESLSLTASLRGEDQTLPGEETDMYIADTMGELGLFYRAAPVACIGRTFSHDGGGGHNPLEAAQLRCAVLHGPRVQNLQEIFDDMDEAGAAMLVKSEEELRQNLLDLLTNEKLRTDWQNRAFNFAKSKEQVIQHVMSTLDPYLKQLRRSEEKP